MTKQEIMDRIYAHFEKHGWVQCTTNELDPDVASRCVYKDPATGHMCAIGCLIPPEMYDPALDAQEGVPATISGLLAQWNEEHVDASSLAALKKIVHELGLDDEEMLEFLMRLQNAHDNPELSMKEEFAEVAHAYNLKFPS